jgi:hypothetical protein
MVRDKLLDEFACVRMVQMAKPMKRVCLALDRLLSVNTQKRPYVNT